MAKKALVVNGYAANVVDAGTLADSFHPDIAAQFVDVPDEVEQGWLLVDDVWSAPPPHPDDGPQRRRVVDRQTLLAMIPANIEFNIRAYAATTVAAEDPTYVPRGTVGILLQRLDTAENVNLDLPANIAGFQFLVTLGLITQELADEILAGPLV